MGSSLSRSVADLSSGDPAEREAAARTISAAACKPANREVIVEVGALAPLVELLGSGSPGAQEAAAEALANLASQTPSNAKAMVAAGSIPPLINLLGSGTDGAKAEAARALTNISCHSPSKRQAIASAGECWSGGLRWCCACSQAWSLARFWTFLLAAPAHKASRAACKLLLALFKPLL